MRLSLVILFASMLFFSCRKDDETNPVLVVNTPLNMVSFGYLDVVTISGSATDDQGLKSIKIEVLDENQNATDFSMELNVNNTQYDYSKSFELDDKHMSSGKYYFKVSAIDKAGNRDSEFIEFNYSELAKELLGIAMINKVSNNVYDFHFFDNSQVNFIQTYTGNFQSLLADSYHEQIWLSAGSSGSLLTYDLANDVITWQKSPQSSLHPYFGNLHQMEADFNVAMARGDSKVVSMDKQGIINRTFTLNAGASGEEILQHNNYVLIEEVINNNHYLVTYVRSTGARVHQLLFSEDIISIQRKDVDEVFVLTSGISSSHLYLYTYLSNSTYEPHSMDPGSASDFVVIDQNEVIIAHSAGLQRFTIDNNSLVTISSDVASQLAYDALSGIVYANVNNNLNGYDHLGNSAGSISTGINLSSFALYYNK